MENQENKQPETFTIPDFFDFNKYRNLDLDNWEDIYNPDLSYPANLFEMASKFLYFPDVKSDYIILLSYALLPTALAKQCPILWIYGKPGSGKSKTGIWVSKVRNLPIFSSNDTGVSLRNSISALKFKGFYERNVLLIWDDLDPQAIKDDFIYRLLKFGYDRNTDKVQIASLNGENLTFRVFSSKLISTIHPIFSQAEFSEIARRSIVIKSLKAPNDYPLSDCDEINWQGFSKKYDEFWEDEDTCQNYVKSRKSLLKYKRLFTVGVDRFSLSLDLMATSLQLGCFNSELECVHFWLNYWQKHLEYVSREDGALKGLLEQFLKESEDTLKDAYSSLGFPMESTLTIAPKEVKNRITLWKAEGRLECNPTPEKIREIMNVLGYRLTVNGWTKDN